MAREAASTRHAHLAISIAIGACAVAVAYAFARLVQAWVYPSPDPRTVTHVARVAFYWRMLLATWAGVLASLGASAALTRAPDRVERVLPLVAIATAAAIVLQGVFVP